MVAAVSHLTPRPTPPPASCRFSYADRTAPRFRFGSAGEGAKHVTKSVVRVRDDREGVTPVRHVRPACGWYLFIRRLRVCSAAELVNGAEVNKWNCSSAVEAGLCRTTASISRAADNYQRRDLHLPASQFRAGTSMSRTMRTFAKLDLKSIP